VRTGIETNRLVITVTVATRNRPVSLGRCLRSLLHIDDLVGEIIVVDDGSDQSVGVVLDSLPPELFRRVRLVEQRGLRGPIVARNTALRLASNDCVLSMDDDAYVIEGSGLRRAVDLLERHKDVVAVACAQAEADGRAWPSLMQPAPASYACYVPAYIGFAHLVRRRVFLQLGGYHERLHFYGEEKDFCLRALDSGYHVVYMPEVLVAHVPDPAGRSPSRYLRHVIRNDCLSSLYNEPFPMPCVTLPMCLKRYFAMRRSLATPDRGGFVWIIRELVAAAPAVWRDRRPVRWSSIWRWRRLRRLSPAFEAR
jgi:GT2 family glycosyltransferase